MKKPYFIFRRPVAILVPVLAVSLTLASAFARAGGDFLSAAEMEEWLMATSGSAVERCEIQYLKSLGWKIVLSDTGKIEIRGGNPCDDHSLASSQASGELEIAIPSGASTLELQELLRKLNRRNPRDNVDDFLVSGQASRCAYKHRVAKATSTVIPKLQANGDYEFSRSGSALPHGFVDLGFLGGVRKGWKPLGSGLRSKIKGLAYHPRRSNAEAMETFFNEKVRTECAAGLHVAEHAIQYQLYGRSDYDQAFANDEIVIGTWTQVQKSNSAIHGRRRGRMKADRMAVRSAHLGGKALIGRTGYLGNVFGEEFLDNKPNRGENLLIAEVSDAASASIVRAGGLEKFNAEMYRIWEIRRDLAPVGEKLLADQELPKDKRMPGRERAALVEKWNAGQNEIKHIYSDPFYTEVMTYTHPFKTYYTFKDHLDHVGEVNPRTPYSLFLYGDIINEGLYDRYAAYHIGQCVKQNPIAPAPVLRENPVAPLEIKETPLMQPAVQAPSHPETLAPMALPSITPYEDEITPEELEELRLYQEEQQAQDPAAAAEEAAEAREEAAQAVDSE